MLFNFFSLLKIYVPNIYYLQFIIIFFNYELKININGLQNRNDLNQDKRNFLATIVKIFKIDLIILIIFNIS